MTIRVEFSGHGHYGICTILPVSLLEKIFQLGAVLLKEKEWEYADFEEHPTWFLGIDKSLKPSPTFEGETEVWLRWHPQKLEQALLSHYLLMKIAYCLPSEEGYDPKLVRPTDLTVDIGPASQGWFVRAALGDQIWDVIESLDFGQLLPRINADIKLWNEDQTNERESAQWARPFLGIDGSALQITQPGCGGGLWIEGSRKVQSLTGYQFSDHNTDSWSQALAHVLSLCIVLKHCRAHVAAATPT